MKKTVEQLLKETVARIGVLREATQVAYEEGTSAPETYPIAREILSIFLDQTKDDCPECGGTGRLEPSHPKYRWEHSNPVTCVCLNCNGAGKVGDWHPERLAVLDPDQDRPAIESRDKMMRHGEALGMRNMLQANFRKIKEAT